ncbi:MAG: hypothetical protein AAFZ80_13895 [Cyanobacteria bacterium P01_A01_bin.105]
MDDSATQLFRMLVEAGAVPGKDFSCHATSGTYHLSERAYILLQLAHPELDLSTFSSRVEPDHVAAAAALNQQLGTDFTEQLMARMAERLSQLPADQQTWYLQQILNGVEQQTGVSIYQLWMAQLSPPLQQRVDQCLDQSPAVPCNHWLQDLVEAAGGSTDDVEWEGDDVLLTENGLRLLTLVWCGEYRVD